ncbi:MAG: serine hydrolase domain-containing protein [Candidatus Eisenbacteria bacterium]
MIKRAIVALLFVILWAAGLVGGALFGWWRRPLAPPGDSAAFMQAAISRVNAGNRANTALVLIERGAIAAEYYSSSADSIDQNTVFTTASLSKWITAHAVMKLVEQGKLDLDRPVESYITRWHLPETSFRSRDVTARRLLSHTAGLTDGLGFGDYRLDEPLPTLEEALTAPRASAGRTSAPIIVGIEPGTRFQYSGGGYLLLELLVEELSGEQFETFVDREVLQPLGMVRSGYADLSATANSAKSYHADGRPAPIHRYASSAATGFTTSAGDMVRWVLAQLRTVEGGPLTKRTLESMRTAEASSMGVDIWGLGTVLYAPTKQGGVIFGHDGTNQPAISATVRINPSTGDAVIVLATGSSALASQLGAEWVFWQTGLPDILTIPTEIRRVMPLLGGGACGIVLVAFVPVWRRRRRSTEQAA